MFDFSNQVALITGASGNLGSAVARAFRASSAKLVLVDRREDILNEVFPDLMADPYCLLTSCADLTNPEEVGSVITAAMQRFGRIDVLVNTVGGYRAGKPLHETSLDTWQFMINVNAATVFITSQAVIPQMIAQKAGKIISLAARPGLRGQADAAAYSASKAAVIRLTESAAAELRHRGINVNCILPGTIDTPQNREAMPDADYDTWVKPESLAEVILFLSSPAARDIHGAAIPVYGLT